MIVLIGTYALSTSQATAAGTTASTIVLISSPMPSTYSLPVTFTATVTGVPGTGNPTGSIKFYDGGTDLGTATLTAGAGVTSMASITISSLSAGTRMITATYNGDATYNTCSSNTVTQVVNKASTMTTLTSLTSPSVYGQPVTLTAAVAGTSGTLTGTVTFSDGSTWTDTVAISPSGEVPSVMISSLSVGSHTITATYNGDANYDASTASPVTQVVNKASTVTTLSSLSNPSEYGQPVTFTATVAPFSPGSGTPTGTVTFSDGSGWSDTVTVSSYGIPPVTISSLSVGAHTITATYNGDANYAASTMSIDMQVEKLATSTTLIASPSPSVYGQPVTLTAMVTCDVGTPTGTITFLDDGSPIGTGTLSGGTAVFTTGALSAGSHTITATYGGDANCNPSASSPVTQVVNPASTMMTLASSQSPSIYGQPVTFTATVSVLSPGTGTPTGTITFYNGSIPLGTGTLNASGIAALATSSLSAGTNQITATYSGDTNYSASTSDMLRQMVEIPWSPTIPVTISMENIYGHATLTPTPTSLPSQFPSLSDATPTPVPTPTSTATTTSLPTQQATTGDLSLWLILAGIGIVAVVAIGYLFLRRQ